MYTWTQSEALSMFVLSFLNTTSEKGVLEGLYCLAAIARHRYKLVSKCAL